MAPLLAGGGPLEDYKNLTDKTVLMPAFIPPASYSTSEELPSDKTNALARIESEPAKRKIAVVQDGPHFVRVFPESQRASFDEVPMRGVELAASNSNRALPGGSIDFSAITAEQVLPFYAAISHRTILRPTALPPVMVRLKTKGPLTQEEASYALATVLAFNGLALVEDGDKFAELVPLAQRRLVNANAPKPESGAKLFNPNETPLLGESKSSMPARPPATQTERELARVQQAIHDFLHHQSPNYSARRLLDFYADLQGKTVQPSEALDAVTMWFHVETPLTKAELLYAIEATFALNNLAIVPVNDREIRLTRTSESGRGAGKTEKSSPPTKRQMLPIPNDNQYNWQATPQYVRSWSLFLILAGKSRCDFPVAERSVRRWNDGAVIRQAEELRRC